MSAEEAIVAKLVATSTVTALVPASRIYLLELPQSTLQLSVVVQPVVKRPRHHMRGPVALRPTWVQVDVYGPKASVDPDGDIRDIADAIEAVLDGQVFTIGTFDVSACHQISRGAMPASAPPTSLLRDMQQYRVEGRAMAA